ncbi:MAG: HDOD domain-containing protein, partial [Deltaproteobacteria bacterium]|nr:HDOD domain-containing protein [Deltaproteobacteria bacterium]
MEKEKSYKIGRFKLERLLSKSNQSSVFLARDTTLDREVVIKLLTDKSLKKGDRFTQAIQEARVVSRLQHPNIISLYEVGEHNNTLYLVFEYVEGFTLRDVIKKKKALSIPSALKIMSQILAGVSMAHEQGVIHHDLKPENIMISGKGVPRVMDFGISLITNDNSEANHQQKGTLHYMAPECFSDGVVSKSADVFSLGLILYEMLTLTQCIEAENEFALVYKIIYEPAVLPSLANPDVDNALDSIFEKAVQKDPRARFQDAGSMKKAIDAYLYAVKDKRVALSVKSETDGILNFLLHRMKYKSDFPAFSKSVMDINEKAEKNPYASARDLANIILKDYSLTNKLLKLVNSAYYGTVGKGVTSIHQAVVILGLEQVRMTAAAMLVFTQIRDRSNIEELKDSMIKSFMSGLMEIEIANRMSAPKTEIGFLCAMFQNLGRNLTVYYFPEEYSDIIALTKEKGIDIYKAAREVLGVSFDELGVCVARHWKFPEAIIYGMRSLPEGVVEKPGSKLETIRHFSVFANELCEIAGNTGCE